MHLHMENDCRDLLIFTVRRRRQTRPSYIKHRKNLSDISSCNFPFFFLHVRRGRFIETLQNIINAGAFPSEKDSDDCIIHVQCKVHTRQRNISFLHALQLVPLVTNFPACNRKRKHRSHFLCTFHETLPEMFRDL